MARDAMDARLSRNATKKGGRTEGDPATAKTREPVGLGGDERPALANFKNAANQARAKDSETTYFELWLTVSFGAVANRIPSQPLL
jgi:hypothetical protein